MEQHAKIVMAPRKPDSDDKNTSIFLAGITTSTGEPDWRETLTKALMNHPVTILNPNRPDWDSTWKEDFSDKRWEEQVWWELDMQEEADIIVFFFHPSTEAPISLMELGLAVKTKQKRAIASPTSGQEGVIYGAGGFSAPDHLLSLDELEERREYAKQLESYIKRGFREFRLRAEHVSTMLMAPIRHFRPGQVFSVQPLEHNGVTYHPASSLELKRNLDGIAPFCEHYLIQHCEGSIIDPIPAQSSPQVTKSSAIPGSSVSECQSDDGFPRNWDMPMFWTNLKLNDHVRDLVQEAKSLERDGNSCVVLDTANPMVSHIIPYTWNDTKEHNNKTGDIKFRGPGLLSVNLLGGSCYACNPHELGGTDKVWNMIWLHPDLHKLWARGYCRFNYIFTENSDENESKVTLQFRWMPQTKKRLGREIDISGTSSGSDWRQLIDELNLFHDPGTPPPVSCEGAFRHLTRSGKPVPSGYLIHINMQTDETKHFKES
ncbi:hypothetical protein LZL87_006867 [Fusarium oxysporum]|nr:hypothetical protein LZL87_006867 [Fusarium oxysporum]